MKRDPRVDPRPGDVVRVLHSASKWLRDPWIERRVDELRKTGVVWVSGRLGYEATMDEWRTMNSDAEIVKVADAD